MVVVSDVKMYALIMCIFHSLNTLRVSNGVPRTLHSYTLSRNALRINLITSQLTRVRTSVRYSV
jgi:hypothetical protein